MKKPATKKQLVVLQVSADLVAVIDQLAGRQYRTRSECDSAKRYYVRLRPKAFARSLLNFKC